MPTPSDDRSDDDLVWLEDQIKGTTAWTRNKSLCEQVVKDILPRWQAKLPAKSWSKVRKRFVKELNESEPCVQFVRKVIRESSNSEESFVVVDIGAGFGFASMLLSELLPSDKVPEIWLLDTAYPSAHQEEALSHQINMNHLKKSVSWPIPLCMRKINLKKGREVSQLDKYVYGRCEQAKIIFMGIHLCKALSVHAINLFQNCPRGIALCLKPCCLPGKRNLFHPVGGKKTPIEYAFRNGYSFKLLDLYRHSRPKNEVLQDDVSVSSSEGSESLEESSQHQEEDEPEQDHGRNSTNRLFSQWIDHLSRGCRSEAFDVTVDNILIQRHHFQNQFLFCQEVRETASNRKVLNVPV